MIDNKIPVQLTREQAYFREISFFEYKNICKMLMSDEIEDINNCLEYIISENVTASKELNIIDKFKCIIAIRNTVLGKEAVFLNDGKQMSLDLAIIADKKFKNDDIIYDILTLSSPVNFYAKSYDEYIAQCLVEIKGTDVTDLSIEQKKQLLGETSLSITDIYKTVFSIFKGRDIEIFKDLRINIYSQEYILQFLKNILYEDLFALLNFEYICVRNLNFKSEDFKNYTYPELKIFLNHLNKEREEQNKSMSEK